MTGLTLKTTQNKEMEVLFGADNAFEVSRFLKNRDLYRCLFVSKHFHSIFSENFRRRALRYIEAHKDSEIWDFIVNEPSLGKFVRSIYLLDKSEDRRAHKSVSKFVRSVAHCVNLESFMVDSNSGMQDRITLQSNPKLKHFMLEVYDNFPKFLTLLERFDLETIEVHDTITNNFSMRSRDVLKMNLNKFPHLKRLKLDYMENYQFKGSGDSVEEIEGRFFRPQWQIMNSNIFPNLKRIVMLDSDNGFVLLKDRRNVESITVHKNNGSCNFRLLSNLSSCNLKTFELHMSEKNFILNLQMLSYLPKSLLNLKFAGAENAKLSDMFTKSISHLKSLESIRNIYVDSEVDKNLSEEKKKCRSAGKIFDERKSVLASFSLLFKLFPKLSFVSCCLDPQSLKFGNNYEKELLSAIKWKARRYENRVTVISRDSNGRILFHPNIVLPSK